jgi:hypothetical protein
MSIQESINQQLITLPENLQAEILDFVMFLKCRHTKFNSISDNPLAEEQRKRKIVDCLTKLSARNPFFEIKDPVAWQREIRKGRPLPGRD